MTFRKTPAPLSAGPTISREHAGEDYPRWVVRAPNGDYVGEAAKLENAKDLARRWSEENQGNQ